jgi:hypothetical protein
MIDLSVICKKTNNLAASKIEGNFEKIKSGGQHEKQLGTWEPSQHLLENRGKPRKSVSRWSLSPMLA